MLFDAWHKIKHICHNALYTLIFLYTSAQLALKTPNYSLAPIAHSKKVGYKYIVCDCNIFRKSKLPCGKFWLGYLFYL